MDPGMTAWTRGALFACPLEPTEAILVISDSPASRTLQLRDSYAFIFVARGRLDVLAGRSRLPLKAGEALLLYAGEPEKIAVCCDEEEVEFYALGFRTSSHPLHDSGRGCDLFVPARAALPRPERLTDLLRRYIAEQQRQGLSRLILYHLIVLALCEIAQAAGNAEIARCRKPGFEIIASSVDAYIAAHYREPIATLDIARELRYNPGYLERSYRQERGVSLRQAIHNRRIKEACAQLLLQKDSRIAEIAAMCGYSDATYFRRAFKQATHVTPSRFRTVHSAGHAPASACRWDNRRRGVIGKRYRPAVRLDPAAGLRQSAGRERLFRFQVSTGIRALNAGLFVSPGYGIHATRVIDSHELIFIAQGHLDMFEEDAVFHLEANQALLLLPGKRHGGRLPYPPDVKFYWLHFQLGDGHAPGGSIRLPKVANVRDPELLTELFCRFISDQESGILEPVSATHLVSLMLCEIGEGEEENLFPPRLKGAVKQKQPLAELVRRYIEQNYRKPITTSVIAHDLRYSADYLERVHRRLSGKSILEALHHKRIAEARALLRNECRKNIKEIAFACGYANPGYFRRIFKRLTGLTPRQLRSLYSRTHINTH